MVNIKELLGRKVTKIVLVSILLEVILLYFLHGQFDLLSVLVYSVVGVIVSSLLKFKMMDRKSFFILGVVISVVYNGGGALLGLFPAGLFMLILSSLEQGLLTWITSMMWGVRK